MLDKAEQNKLHDVVKKYYEISSEELKGETVVFRVPTFHLEPEQHFIRLTRELESLGFLTFTSTDDVDEIIVMEKPSTKNKLVNRIKLALFLGTLLSLLYFGYVYQSSYQGIKDPLQNFLTSLLFFMLPISVIFAGREAGKYVAMKRNGMQYDFPIFIPNPMVFGSMGTINSPNKPYVSRRVMIEAGSFSIIGGFMISTVFLIIGSLTTYSFPPSAPIVNSTVQTIGSPLIMQVIVNRLIPSNGILDPLALAGWSGIVITAFNALPLGFLDGGLISSALFGKNATYLSYLSIFVIVALGLFYPPWFILAVFALLVGLRGPQPLNNLTKLKFNTKVIAAVSFAIVVVGIAPFPFHPGINTFTASPSQSYFVLHDNQGIVDLNLTVNNTGQSTIVPAFEISPSEEFQLSGQSRSIEPGSHFVYDMQFYISNKTAVGFHTYQLTVYSGSYFKTLKLTVLKVNTTTALLFNNQIPYMMHPNANGTVHLNLTTAIPENLYLLSIGGPNITFSYFPQNNFSKVTYSKNMAYILSSPSQTESSNLSITRGAPLRLTLQLDSSPAYWYIIAYDSNYTAAIAEYIPSG